MAWTNVQWGTVCIEAASDDVPETVANLLVKSEDCDRWKLSSVKLMKSRRNDVVTLNMEGLPYGRCDRSIYSPASRDIDSTLADKKLSYRRETARCFVSLNISLNHSRSLKVIRNDILRRALGGPRPNCHTLWHGETNGVVWGYV